ncbi:hypothetical protein MNBD_BACTEROID01-1330 [hydrothermal vent metagenome]|uniref:Uncharacterized protein n=1 Tax=hydrothermal vent metagenome TaxID=652676 RepID=A0A3B0TZ09_9ZZZZ
MTSVSLIFMISYQDNPLRLNSAEMIKNRVDASKPFLGLTSFKGNYITQQDVGIAKKYVLPVPGRQENL